MQGGRVAPAIPLRASGLYGADAGGRATPAAPAPPVLCCARKCNSMPSSKHGAGRHGSTYMRSPLHPPTPPASNPTHLNSCMMASRSFCTMSPCMDATVKLFCRIFSVSQSTCGGVGVWVWVWGWGCMGMGVDAGVPVRGERGAAGVGASRGGGEGGGWVETAGCCRHGFGACCMQECELRGWLRRHETQWGQPASHAANQCVVPLVGIANFASQADGGGRWEEVPGASQHAGAWCRQARSGRRQVVGDAQCKCLWHHFSSGLACSQHATGGSGLKDYLAASLERRGVRMQRGRARGGVCAAQPTSPMGKQVHREHAALHHLQMAESTGHGAVTDGTHWPPLARCRGLLTPPSTPNLELAPSTPLPPHQH